MRAERIVVATGAVEQPLVFPGNDLVGVMLPDGARRLIRDFALKPGERAVVIAADDRALGPAAELARGGRRGRHDRRPPRGRARDDRGRGPARRPHRGRDRRRARTSATCCVASGTPQPAYSLLAQAGARVEYDAARGIFVPRDLPAGVEAVGPRRPASSARSCRRAARHGDDGFVCVCEDVAREGS